MQGVLGDIPVYRKQGLIFKGIAWYSVHKAVIQEGMGFAAIRLFAPQSRSCNYPFAVLCKQAQRTHLFLFDLFFYLLMCPKEK